MRKSEGIQRGGMVKALERLSASRRPSDSPLTLVWAALGLVLALFYAFLLTTRWFG
jgi:Co/Zn/Cd efflux system component